MASTLSTFLSLFSSKKHRAAAEHFAEKDMKLGKRQVREPKSLRNRAILCVLLLLAFLLYHDPFEIFWWSQKPVENMDGILPLDMATDSIDDMYDGCRSEAASVIDQFGVFEWHYNRNFSFAWALIERHAKKLVHKQLKEEHAIVMYIYTKVKNIRQAFNEAVKTGKQNYNTYKFKFHYFYFFLTDAIQLLHQNRTSCRVTYHRTWNQFNHNVINTNMRFGAFTLAASTKQSFDFNGNVSCFEIYTCFGADITNYSATNLIGQVLIPPYEVFRITDILTNEPWCSVVYKLQSTQIPRRDLNCKISPRQITTYTFSTQWDASSSGKMLTCLILLTVISLVLVKLKQLCFVAAVLCSLLLLMVIVLILRQIT